MDGSLKTSDFPFKFGEVLFKNFRNAKRKLRRFASVSIKIVFCLKGKETFLPIQ